MSTYLGHLRWQNTRCENPQQGVSLLKNNQRSQNLLLKVDSALLFVTTFFNPQQMFLLHDKTILEGEKCETSTQNLQQNNVV